MLNTPKSIKQKKIQKKLQKIQQKKTTKNE